MIRNEVKAKPLYQLQNQMFVTHCDNNVSKWLNKKDQRIEFVEFIRSLNNEICFQTHIQQFRKIVITVF